MIRSMFSGVAGLRTHQSKMDVIGNNIANVNTTGYKSARATFIESIYQTSKSGGDGNNVYGGTNPSQIGYGSQIGSVDVNYGTGSYEPTGYGTDCMIDGTGFFLVGPKLDADGGVPTIDDGVGNSEDDGYNASSLYLTRTGNFRFDGDGYLVDGNGNVVYGFVGEGGNAAMGENEFKYDTSMLVPIRIPHDVDDAAQVPAVDYEDTERLNLSNISIGPDGVITGTGEFGTYKIGVIAVCNVPNPNGLNKVQNSYYEARTNTGLCEAFAPGNGTTGQLIPNGLEMANVDLATEFSNMITTQRGFQANSKIITVSDEMLQELISMKR